MKHFNATHGLSGTPEHIVWNGMRQRCLNPGAVGFKSYGARGITICGRWSSFETFLSDMGPRPMGTTLDRIDNDGNYEPSNCRWATRKEQARNRRSSHIVTIGGSSRTIAEWAEMAGLDQHTIIKRIARGISGVDLLRLEHRRQRGEACPISRLTEDVVRRMRELAPSRSIRSIAIEYGVDHKTALNAIRGNTWAHVQ